MKTNFVAVIVLDVFNKLMKSIADISPYTMIKTMFMYFCDVM